MLERAIAIGGDRQQTLTILDRRKDGDGVPCRQTRTSVGICESCDCVRALEPEEALSRRRQGRRRVFAAANGRGEEQRYPCDDSFGGSNWDGRIDAYVLSPGKTVFCFN